MNRRWRTIGTVLAALLILCLSGCGDAQNETRCTYHLSRANGAVAQGNAAAAAAMLWIAAEDSSDTASQADTATAKFYWAAAVALADHAREHFEVALSECSYWNDEWTDETEGLFDGFEELCARFKREFEWPC